MRKGIVSITSITIIADTIDATSYPELPVAPPTAHL